MSNFKTYGAVAIMIGCFVVIYPRFMHPIFLNIFGLRDPPKPNDHEAHHAFPPGHKPHPGGGAEDMRRNMRHGPHPGMRAAAEMQRQQGQQGSGRGMMGVVLPMYAVGIVLYLAYTLYKVFNKTHNKDNPYGRNRYARDRYNRERERDAMGFPKDFDANQDIRNFLHDQQHRNNLEDLLTRVDDKNVSVEEMRVLQSRLEETEAQMTRILRAMHAVNANMDNLKNPEADPNEGKGTQEGSQPGDVVKDSGKSEDDKTTETNAAAADEPTAKADKMTKENDADAKAEKGMAQEDQSNVEEEHVNSEEAVDELIEERNNDEDEDEKNNSSVRQRNVKSNEQ